MSMPSSGRTVKFRYPCDGFDSGTCVRLLGRGVDAFGPAGWVRKVAMLLGRVVSCDVAADDPTVSRDLNGVANDPDLDREVLVGISTTVVTTGDLYMPT